MKKFLPIIALLVFTSVAHSQNNKRYWNEGKLRWNDFRVISTTEPQKSYLQYTIAYHPDSKDSNGIHYKYYKVDAYMLPRNSWVNDQYMNSQNLLYNQVIFDFIEVTRRQMQATLHTSCRTDQFQSLLEEHTLALSNRIEQFRKASSDGEDSAALALYKEQVDRELSALQVSDLPHYELRPFNGELFVGLGTVLNSGSLSDLFPTCGAMLNYGLGLGLNRHSLLVDCAMGRAAARSDAAVGSHNFLSGESYNTLLASILYGYRIIDSDKLSLRLLAGIGGNEFCSTERKGPNYFSAVCTRPVFGISLMRHIYTQFQAPMCTPFRGWDAMSERDRISIYGKILVTHSAFNEISTQPRGLNIALQVGIWFGAQSVNL